jgi:hypothetical protein
LTPTFFRPRRFETAFFLLALNEKPEIHPESVHEVEEFMVINDWKLWSPNLKGFKLSWA